MYSVVSHDARPEFERGLLMDESCESVNCSEPTDYDRLQVIELAGLKMKVCEDCYADFCRNAFPPGVLYVTLHRFALNTGFSEAVIRSKIESKDWEQGKLWTKVAGAPLIMLAGFTDRQCQPPCLLAAPFSAQNSRRVSGLPAGGDS
jgi:hypothetical protein